LCENYLTILESISDKVIAVLYLYFSVVG